MLQSCVQELLPKFKQFICFTIQVLKCQFRGGIGLECLYVFTFSYILAFLYLLIEYFNFFLYLFML